MKILNSLIASLTDNRLWWISLAHKWISKEWNYYKRSLNCCKTKKREKLNVNAIYLFYHRAWAEKDFIKGSEWILFVSRELLQELFQRHCYSHNVSSFCFVPFDTRQGKKEVAWENRSQIPNTIRADDRNNTKKKLWRFFWIHLNVCARRERERFREPKRQWKWAIFICLCLICRAFMEKLNV